MTLTRLIVLALVGVLLFSIWQISRPADIAQTATAQGVAAAWLIPQRPTVDPVADVAQITENHLWGAPLMGGALTMEAPLTPPNWRITGVISAGGETYAVVSTEATKIGLLLPGVQPPKYEISQLRVGDRLPGGASILHIQPDRLGILLNGKKRILRVYQE
ncbi:hypothetical protein [Chitinimonas naiadis]